MIQMTRLRKMKMPTMTMRDEESNKDDKKDDDLDDGVEYGNMDIEVDDNIREETLKKTYCAIALTNRVENFFWKRFLHLLWLFSDSMY